jgi:hypothetical protein
MFYKLGCGTTASITGTFRAKILMGALGCLQIKVTEKGLGDRGRASKSTRLF